MSETPNERPGDYKVALIERRWAVVFVPDDQPDWMLAVAWFPTQARAMDYCEMQNGLMDAFPEDPHRHEDVKALPPPNSVAPEFVPVAEIVKQNSDQAVKRSDVGEDDIDPAFLDDDFDEEEEEEPAPPPKRKHRPSGKTARKVMGDRPRCTLDGAEPAIGDDLTDTQVAAWRGLCELIAETGRSPSQSDIAARSGASPGSVTYLLERLENGGYIEILGAGYHRTYRIKKRPVGQTGPALDLTGRLMGDPPPGRSAADQRGQT